MTSHGVTIPQHSHVYNYMPLLYAGDMQPICNSNLLARIVINFHSNEL